MVAPAMALLWSGNPSKPEGQERGVVVVQSRFSEGSFAIMYKGQWSNGDGKEAVEVALKRLKNGRPQPILLNRLLREIRIWSGLNHPRILPLLGTCKHQTGQNVSYFIVSPYKRNGTAMEYLRSNPSANRVALLSHVAEGLLYLHTPTKSKDVVVHGDIKGDNILIDDDGTAVLGDFGVSRIIQGELGASSTLIATTSSLRLAGAEVFKAPELFKNGVQKTPASDVWAYGILVYQFYTGDLPFKGETHHYVDALDKNMRPLRPANCESGQVWAITQACWAIQARRRLTMADISLRMQYATAMDVVERDQGQFWEKTNDTSRCNRQIGNADLFYCVPISIIRKGLHFGRLGSRFDVWESQARGGFSTVYRGLAHLAGPDNVTKTIIVAVKLFRTLRPNAFVRSIFDSEFRAWTAVNHAHILPFFGYIRCLEHETFGFVSPWMDQGNMMEYLSRNPNADREILLFQVADAVAYLHAPSDGGNVSGIVHGDLIGENVLISPGGSALLCDFGLSVMLHNFTYPTDDDDAKSVINAGLSGPEPFANIDDVQKTYASDILVVDIDEGQKTYASDVIAFGWLIYQIYAGRHCDLGKLSRPSLCHNNVVWGLVSACTGVYWDDGAVDQQQPTIMMGQVARLLATCIM